MKNKCQIIKDLLLLNEEELCSEESKQAIEEHLNQCEGCRTYQENLKKNFDLDSHVNTDSTTDSEDDNETKAQKQKNRKLIKSIHRFKRKMVITTSLILIVVLLVVGINGTLIYNQIKHEGISYTTFDDYFKAKEIAKQLENGEFEKFVSKMVTANYDNMKCRYEHYLESLKSYDSIQDHKLQLEGSSRVEAILVHTTAGDFMMRLKSWLDGHILSKNDYKMTSNGYYETTKTIDIDNLLGYGFILPEATWNKLASDHEITKAKETIYLQQSYEYNIDVKCVPCAPNDNATQKEITVYTMGDDEYIKCDTPYGVYYMYKASYFSYKLSEDTDTPFWNSTTFIPMEVFEKEEEALWKNLSNDAEAFKQAMMEIFGTNWNTVTEKDFASNLKQYWCKQLKSYIGDGTGFKNAQINWKEIKEVYCTYSDGHRECEETEIPITFDFQSAKAKNENNTYQLTLTLEINRDNTYNLFNSHENVYTFLNKEQDYCDSEAREKYDKNHFEYGNFTMINFIESPTSLIPDDFVNEGVFGEEMPR
ncbi:MAG: hypothetical protein K5895_12675 [Lachnospiraceae bacterium]|nr:hypothetical protein [Lachnospiraceae bacterium]